MKTISISSMPHVDIVWDIYRGLTTVKESFTAGQFWVWLTGNGNSWYLSADVDGEGSITTTLPTGLTAGVYSIYAIWSKEQDPKDTLASITESDKRCRSDVQNILCLSSASDAEHWSGDTMTIKIKSSVATYGYDGLGAYEVACIKGYDEDLDEETWYNNMFTSASSAADSATAAADSAREAEETVAEVTPRITALEKRFDTGEGHAWVVDESLDDIYSSSDTETLAEWVNNKMSVAHVDIIAAIKEIHDAVDYLYQATGQPEPYDWKYYND